jgi:hypothetical protein
MDVRIDDSFPWGRGRDGAAHQALHKQSPLHISY